MMKGHEHVMSCAFLDKGGLGGKGAERQIIVFKNTDNNLLGEKITMRKGGNMTDYVTLWDDYSVKFNRILEFNFNGDWDQLDQEEREIAGLWKLLVDVYNGGFEQFFCNWGYRGYWYAMCGLQKVGDRVLLERFHNTYQQVFNKFKEDSRLKAYWDIPRYLTEEDKTILEKTNQYFWDKAGENFAKLAYEYYHDQLKKQPRK